MDYDTALTLIVRPTCAWLETDHDIPHTPAAEVMLLTIAMQESGLRHRRQINGPARSYWQFERDGGVHGVFTHKRTAGILSNVCSDLSLQHSVNSVYADMEYNDTLACVMARLLLYSDERALPKLSASTFDDAWHYYIRNWRPGKPHPDTWPNYWNDALECVMDSAPHSAVLVPTVDTIDKRVHTTPARPAPCTILQVPGGSVTTCFTPHP